VGVGIEWLQNSASEFIVKTVPQGYPAWATKKIFPNDVLLSIDQQRVGPGSNVRDFVMLRAALQGDAGTSVQLVLRRDGATAPISVPVTRGGQIQSRDQTPPHSDRSPSRSTITVHAQRSTLQAAVGELQITSKEGPAHGLVPEVWQVPSTSPRELQHLPLSRSPGISPKGRTMVDLDSALIGEEGLHIGGASGEGEAGPGRTNRSVGEEEVGDAESIEELLSRTADIRRNASLLTTFNALLLHTALATDRRFADQAYPPLSHPLSPFPLSLANSSERRQERANRSTLPLKLRCLSLARQIATIRAACETLQAGSCRFCLALHASHALSHQHEEACALNPDAVTKAEEEQDRGSIVGYR